MSFVLAAIAGVGPQLAETVVVFLDDPLGSKTVSKLEATPVLPRDSIGDFPMLISATYLKKKTGSDLIYKNSLSV
ncbi:MAG: hypothetical protein ACYS30_13355 [Planctomycetota bacterium]|jgi:hypothetical protein